MGQSGERESGPGDARPTGQSAAIAAELGLSVEPPLVLDDPDAAPWDETAALVVAGLGGAGVAAALERGLSVIAADRYDAAGAAIHGLDAARRTAISIASPIYVSGLSFADCVYSGRRAARHAARANR